ncbi:GNAT family N-acetyltransferase [Actinokineospora sp. 24-640]
MITVKQANRPPGEGRVLIKSERLTLRPWRGDDDAAAWAIYGHAEVAGWLSPDLEPVPDLAAMRLLLGRWIAEEPLPAPTGRWAIERDSDGQVIGGALLLPLPPGDEDLRIAWHLRPDAWGKDYSGECAFALASWAFSQDVDEVFAVVRPDNTHAATAARRNGMHWVGETGKYFGRETQVFRLRPADLDRFAPEGHHPPNCVEA